MTEYTSTRGDRGVLLRDLLGSRPGLERVDDSLERDPRSRHAHHTLGVGVDGHAFDDVGRVHD
jgi:hypothetical protein